MTISGSTECECGKPAMPGYPDPPYCQECWAELATCWYKPDDCPRCNSPDALEDKYMEALEYDLEGVM